MMAGRNKILTALIFVIFAFSVAAGFLWGSRFMNLPERKPTAVLTPVDFINPKVSSETIMMKYKEYLCGDMEKISEETAPAELRGLDRKKIIEKFPGDQGYVVSFTEPKYLTLTSKSDEFCPIHRTYRHLGLYNGLVAVYEGPLGVDKKVLRAENIPMETLDPDLRIKLEQVMDFHKQARSAAEQLRGEFEFTSEEALNAALENLDEHS